MYSDATSEDTEGDAQTLFTLSVSSKRRSACLYVYFRKIKHILTFPDHTGLNCLCPRAVQVVVMSSEPELTGGIM